jgi:trans-2,3-dihydro-3-hydroxyanthranilate isomerase
MTEYRYLHLDVFTRTPLRGNQLAVFLDPLDWPDVTRQDIAREMSFSETTFVHPPKSAGALASMRIFTPGGELPMAGHPTIGTTFALAASGRIKPGLPGIVLDLLIGPTQVDLQWKDGALDFAWMTQPLPTLFSAPSPSSGNHFAPSNCGHKLRNRGVSSPSGWSLGVASCSRFTPAASSDAAS